MILDLDPDVATEVVVTLAEHHDRRVIEPLVDLIASRRANTMMVRAAGWLADPALHPALVQLAATRVGDLGDEEHWTQVGRAIARCDPGASDRAEQIEVALLAATHASLLDSDLVGVDVFLDGTYPSTEVVLRFGDRERRHPIWNFDETAPDDPSSLDLAFTRYRIASLASWG